MNRKDIEELVQQQASQQKPLAKIEQLTENKLIINEHHYLIVANPSDSFDIDTFKIKYNAALSKYDFIVGDISFGQLRLKGFYSKTRNAPSDMRINTLQDYLMEYCNFGVQYYVLCNLEVLKKHFAHHRRKRHYQNGKKFKIKGKRTDPKTRNAKKKVLINKRKKMLITKSSGKSYRHFTIRQKKFRR